MYSLSMLGPQISGGVKDSPLSPRSWRTQTNLSSTLNKTVAPPVQFCQSTAGAATPGPVVDSHLVTSE